MQHTHRALSLGLVNQHVTSIPDVEIACAPRDLKLFDKAAPLGLAGTGAGALTDRGTGNDRPITRRAPVARHIARFVLFFGPR